MPQRGNMKQGEERSGRPTTAVGPTLLERTVAAAMWERFPRPGAPVEVPVDRAPPGDVAAVKEALRLHGWRGTRGVTSWGATSLVIDVAPHEAPASEEEQWARNDRRIRELWQMDSGPKSPLPIAADRYRADCDLLRAYSRHAYLASKRDEADRDPRRVRLDLPVDFVERTFFGGVIVHHRHPAGFLHS